MTKLKIHIVSFDVPYPPDYGGVIDVFHRLKSLKEHGFEIFLHVFEYGRGKQDELEKYSHVFYYKRTRFITHVLSSRPFIVQSRKNEALLNNLLRVDAPILFEGIHTAYYLEDKRIQNRTTLVRMHNLEHNYYFELAQKSPFWKRWFYLLEAYKLKKYQHVLSHASNLLAVKSSDLSELKKFNEKAIVLPVHILSLPQVYNEVKPYALFHGNLSVPENENAALWIINTLKDVLNTDFRLIIAGKNPHKKLIEANNGTTIQLVSNPDDFEMKELLTNAHIHVLYTTVPAGVKHKLLVCMQSPGHILLNQYMLPENSFSSFCEIKNSSDAFKEAFLSLKTRKLSKEEFEKRISFVNRYYTNHSNAELIQHIIDENV